MYRSVGQADTPIFLFTQVQANLGSQSSRLLLLMFDQTAFPTLAERRDTEKQIISEKVQSIPASRNA